MNSFKELHGTAAIFNRMYKSLSNKGQDEMRTVIKVSFFPMAWDFIAMFVKDNLGFWSSWTMLQSISILAFSENSA